VSSSGLISGAAAVSVASGVPLPDASAVPGVSATTAPVAPLTGAVGDVLKVITSHLDDVDLRQSLTKQTAQDKSIRAVTSRLSALEKSTKDLIASTQKQTAALRGMLNIDELKAPVETLIPAVGSSAAAAAPAPAPAPSPATPASSAASSIAMLKRLIAAETPKGK